MTWETALAWWDVLPLTCRLGIWRAQIGPGPWSIFLLCERGILEVWALPGHRLVGKVWQSAKRSGK